MSQVYLLTGSNLEDRMYYLNKAKEEIKKCAGSIEKESSVFESEPWGFVHKNNFLNQVLYIETLLQPFELLQVLLGIESSLNRIRQSNQYTARTIDIDILFYDDLIIYSKNLTIPHPKIQDRKFTLLPLCELSPNLMHPVLKKNMKALLEECSDLNKVWLFI